MSDKIIYKQLDHGTNILRVALPTEMQSRISTGIHFLDDCFGQGLGAGIGMVPGSSVLISGTPGVGKTTLWEQAADKLTEMGHIAVFNSSEESLYQVRSNVSRLGLKHGFIAGSDSNVEDIIAHVEAIKGANPNRQVILIQDSIQRLKGRADDDFSDRASLRSAVALRDWCKRTFGIFVAIGQVTKDGKFAGLNKVKHELDVHMHFWLDLGKKSPTKGQRVLEVEKNRFGVAGQSYVVQHDRTGVHEVSSYVEYLAGSGDNDQ